MNDLLRKYWPIAVGVAAIVLIGGCIYDIAAGGTLTEETTVQAKEYVPPWTEISTRWVPGDDDSPGRMVSSTTHHPARYKVFTREGVELLVTAGQYHQLGQWDEITIRRKVGRWTGLKYPWHLYCPENK